MPNIGPLEIVVVLIIALVVFGPKRLPELDPPADGAGERVDGEVVGHRAP